MVTAHPNAVYTNAKWQVKEGHLKAVLKILSDVAKKSTEEEGNLFYEVYQSSTDSNTIILHEGYVDATGAEAHRNTDHFQNLVLKQIVPLLEKREVIHMNQIL